MFPIQISSISGLIVVGNLKLILLLFKNQIGGEGLSTSSVHHYLYLKLSKITDNGKP